MVESAVGFHNLAQAAFAGMAERRMPQIMRQSNGFAEFFIELEAFAQSAGDLGDLNAVGKPGAVVFALMIGKNLGFSVETAKRHGVNQTVAVALKRRTDNVDKVRVHTTPAVFGFYGISGEFHKVLPLSDFLLYKSLLY